MEEPDTRESVPIVERMMTHLAATVPPTGVGGSQARTLIGNIAANAYTLLRTDTLGPPLNQAFILAEQAGATFAQIEQVRAYTEAEQPVSLGATLVVNAGIELCLATESEIIASMTFVSRQDVDAVQQTIADPFNEAIETAADDMDQMAFQALVALYAAVTNHLVTTARPLPRLVGYQFFRTMPSLVLSNRLYADASRADELRDENKVVHPAFCPRQGIALSA